MSAWILLAHGLRKKGFDAGNLIPNIDETRIHASGDFINRWLGPTADVRQAKRSIAQAQKIVDVKAQDFVDANESANFERFQTLISETTVEIMGAAGIPHILFQSPGLSLDQFTKLRRAIRATLICLVLHNEHPLVLVKRAKRGGP